MAKLEAAGRMDKAGLKAIAISKENGRMAVAPTSRADIVSKTCELPPSKMLPFC